MNRILLYNIMECTWFVTQQLDLLAGDTLADEFTTVDCITNDLREARRLIFRMLGMDQLEVFILSCHEQSTEGLPLLLDLSVDCGLQLHGAHLKQKSDTVWRVKTPKDHRYSTAELLLNIMTPCSREINPVKIRAILDSIVAHGGIDWDAVRFVTAECDAPVWLGLLAHIFKRENQTNEFEAVREYIYAIIWDGVDVGEMQMHDGVRTNTARTRGFDLLMLDAYQSKMQMNKHGGWMINALLAISQHDVRDVNGERDGWNPLCAALINIWINRDYGRPHNTATHRPKIVGYQKRKSLTYLMQFATPSTIADVDIITIETLFARNYGNKVPEFILTWIRINSNKYMRYDSLIIRLTHRACMQNDDVTLVNVHKIRMHIECAAAVREIANNIGPYRGKVQMAINCVTGVLELANSIGPQPRNPLNKHGCSCCKMVYYLYNRNLPSDIRQLIINSMMRREPTDSDFAQMYELLMQVRCDIDLLIKLFERCLPLMLSSRDLTSFDFISSLLCKPAYSEHVPALITKYFPLIVNTRFIDANKLSKMLCELNPVSNELVAFTERLVNNDKPKCERRNRIICEMIHHYHDTTQITTRFRFMFDH